MFKDLVTASFFVFARKYFSAGLLTLLSGSVAVAVLESNLIEHSPFLPPGYNNQKATPVAPVEAPVVQGPLSRQLELRGIFEMNGVVKFSIFDKTKQEGDWIQLNQSSPDSKFTISKFNRDADSIIITSSGRSEELSLIQADDKPIQVSGVAVPNFTPPSPPPNFKPPTPAPTSPPSSSPPSTIPPPPPAALLQARANNASGTNVPRRRIIRRTETSDSTGTAEASAGGSSSTMNIPPPPNFTPGPAPNFIPGPPPSSN